MRSIVGWSSSSFGDGYSSTRSLWLASALTIAGLVCVGAWSLANPGSDESVIEEYGHAQPARSSGVVPELPGEVVVVPELPAGVPAGDVPELPGEVVVVPELPGEVVVVPELPGEVEVVPELPGEVVVVPELPAGVPAGDVPELPAAPVVLPGEVPVLPAAPVVLPGEVPVLPAAPPSCPVEVEDSGYRSTYSDHLLDPRCPRR